MHPAPHLPRVHTELFGEPGLAATLGREDLSEGRIGAVSRHVGRCSTCRRTSLSSCIDRSSIGGMPPADLDLPFGARLRKLRENADLSRSKLSRATVGFDGEGIAEETIKALELGKWGPSIKSIAALAHGMQLRPEVFPEFRLARARRLLDEREIGLREALLTLEAVEHSLLAAAGKAAQRAAEVSLQEKLQTEARRHDAPREGSPRTRPASRGRKGGAL